MEKEVDIWEVGLCCNCTGTFNKAIFPFYGKSNVERVVLVINGLKNKLSADKYTGNEILVYLLTNLKQYYMVQF